MDGAFRDLIWPFLMSGGGGAIAFWFLAKPVGENFVAWLTLIQANVFGFNSPQVKRIVAGALGLLVSLGLWAIGLPLGWAELPVGAEAWLNLIVWLGGLSFTGSQGLHLFKLRE